MRGLKQRTEAARVWIEGAIEALGDSLDREAVDLLSEMAEDLDAIEQKIAGGLIGEGAG